MPVLTKESWKGYHPLEKAETKTETSKQESHQRQRKALPNDKGLTLQEPLTSLQCAPIAWHQDMPSRKTDKLRGKWINTLLRLETLKAHQ